jgi:hypothetical protein
MTATATVCEIFSDACHVQCMKAVAYVATVDVYLL